MNTQTSRCRRLHDQVDLCAPLSVLEQSVFLWASQLGFGAIFSLQQLIDLRARLDASPERTPENRHTSLDAVMAIGAIQARNKEPVDGWRGYIARWEEEGRNAARGYGTQMDQLRALQDAFGGILLNSRAAAFVLLIPLTGDRWVKMGWSTIELLAGSPLDDAFAPVMLERRVIPEREGSAS